MEFLSACLPLDLLGREEWFCAQRAFLGTDLHPDWTLFSPQVSLGFNCSHRDRHSPTTYFVYTCVTGDETETQRVR